MTNIFILKYKPEKTKFSVFHGKNLKVRFYNAERYFAFSLVLLKTEYYSAYLSKLFNICVFGIIPRKSSRILFPKLLFFKKIYQL